MGACTKYAIFYKINLSFAAILKVINKTYRFKKQLSLFLWSSAGRYIYHLKLNYSINSKECTKIK